METKQELWSEFEKTWTRQIVASINKVRKEANLTVKQLSERLSAVGWPVSSATLSGMLSGDKRSSVSVAEVAAFARALGVSPLFLTLGLPYAERLPTEHALQLPPTTDIYDITAWYFGDIIRSAQTEDLREEPFRSISLNSGATLAFIERTTHLSDMIYSDISEIVALNEIEGLGETWRENEVERSTRRAEVNLAALRRTRSRHFDRAAKSELAHILVLPLPEAFAFVDSEVPIGPAFRGLSIEMLKSLCVAGRLEASKRVIERKYSEEMERELNRGNEEGDG